ncbi:MAG: hypothetical protein U5N26_07455 [Candidatus Marinimicrobia bacterium]|nr:hypothetical protein [Candidatus Neomarinimicrobiota bacterium]
MKYLHQEKTFQKARDFSSFLNGGEFRAIPDIDGTRDYLSKIDVYAAGLYLGKVNVYYSPKKNRYSITTQSVTVPSYRDVLREQWQQFLDKKHPSDDRLCAYVDGSFMNGCVGYGAVIVQNGKVLHEIKRNA